MFDKNADVGGTWFENTYPDLRVDVPNHFYSYSFRPNPDWSHYYARQRTSWSSTSTSCAKEHGVLPHVRFGTEVLSADFDETPRLGGPCAPRHATADESEVEVDVARSAQSGCSTARRSPTSTGLDTFAGP